MHSYSPILRRFVVSSLLLLLGLAMLGGSARASAAPRPLPRAQIAPSGGRALSAAADAALASNNWTQVPPIDPSGGPLIYDPDTQTTLVLDTLNQQAWSWNGSAWSLQHISNELAGGGMAYDPVTHSILATVGEPGPNGNVWTTWTFANDTWTQQPTTTTPSFQILLATIGSQVVIYGENSTTGAPATFAWDGATWSEHDLPTQNVPQLTTGTGLVGAGNVFLLYGSCCDINSQRLADTWTLDPSTGVWTPHCGTGFSGAKGVCGPGSRSDENIVSTGSGVLLFGGADVNATALGDTWSWNGSAWAQLCTSAPCTTITPQPRENARIAYDAHRQQMILLGGLVLRGLGGGATQYYGLDDTWLWNGSAWTEPVSAGSNPPPRSGAGFASTGSQLVLFGGASTVSESAFDNVLGDTWVWNGSAWAQQCTTAPCSTNAPPARAGASMAYDGRQTVLFGGSICGDTCTLFDDTWVWDGTKWTAVCGVTGKPVCGPSARTFASLALDSTHQQLVLFGGCSGEGFVSGEDECSGSPFGDTWTWSGSSDTWAQACTTTVCKASLPPARSDASISWDGQQIVLFGGCSGADGGACVPDSELGDTWTWSGSAWTQRCSTAPCNANVPSATADASLAYDGREAVLYDPGIPFGGAYPSTWIWSGASGSWTEICSEFGTPNCGPTSCTLFGPPQCLFPRASAAIAYDVAANTVFLFSGGQTTPYSGLDDIWAWQAGPLVSASRSKVAPNFAAVPDNGFAVTLVVTVNDGNGNPLAGQTITLTGSSGMHSQIVAVRGTVSNSQGQVSFSITDATPELVTYTATAGGVQLTPQTPPQVTFELQGDVNLDGSVTATDALCALRDVAKLPATAACPQTAATLSAADVNRDPTDDTAGPDATDALCALRIVAHLPATQACPLFDGARTVLSAIVAPSPRPVPEREGATGASVAESSPSPSSSLSSSPPSFLGKGAGGLGNAEVSAAAGKQTRVTITADGGSAELGAWTVDAQYDPSQVKVVSCEAADGGICNASYAAGVVRIVGASASGLSGSQDLATLTLDGVSHGERPTGLTVTVVTLAGPMGSPLPGNVAAEAGAGR